MFPLSAIPAYSTYHGSNCPFKGSTCRPTCALTAVFHTTATERKGDFTNTMVRIYEFRGCLSHGCPRCFKSSMDKTTLCCPSAHQVNLSWILYRKKSTYSKQGSGSSLSGRAIGNLMLRPALVLQAILTSRDFHIRSRHSTKAIHGFL